MNKTLGQIAFEAYVVKKNGTTYDDKPIPEWNRLGDEVRGAWEAAANAAIEDFKQLAADVLIHTVDYGVYDSYKLKKAMDRLEAYLLGPDEG